jgi:3-methyladenine DNA glycosylase AlkD
MRIEVPDVDVEEVMGELEALGTATTKKNYVSRGVREPLFGVPTGSMKPLKKRIGVDQALADQLWDTGNYDAMYFAGMIADARAMTEADFERWIDGSYSPMVSDFIVAVTLAESPIAEQVASRWARSGDEQRQSAGWVCWEWLLGWKPDSALEPSAIHELLKLAEATYGEASPDVRHAMRGFITAVGVSYLPLHNEGLETAERIDAQGAVKQIRTAIEKGRLGFKRRAVRC